MIVDVLLLPAFWSSVGFVVLREFLSQRRRDRADRASMATWDAWRREMERTP